MVGSLASESTNLRRRRRSDSEEERTKKDHGYGSSSSLQIDSNSGDTSNNHRMVTSPRLMLLVAMPRSLILLHVMAVSMLVWGWILRMNLHTSVECDMTYSQRQLIPIPLIMMENKSHATYRLYKFIDQRDPRPHHRAMMQRWLNTIQVTGEDDHRYQATQLYLKDHQSFLEDSRRYHCTPRSLYNGQNGTMDTTVAVLYIPGHWGSYMQSRSIGAHGIQLTGARGLQQQQKVLHALTNNLWKGLEATNISQFVFDVYAMDFQEQGAALHAQFLWTQTAFVASAIQHIVVSVTTGISSPCSVFWVDTSFG